jgi:hypothetical protein
MIVRRKVVLWAAAAVLIVVCSAFLWWMFDPIDRCLDRGGRWDYETRQCDFGGGTEQTSMRE